ncbi:hypothetical protein [Chroococcidiopsis sp. SAG 2025]|nr:hypothetical protein [Chroococcidiopsis sp. SAG 2025]
MLAEKNIIPEAIAQLRGVVTSNHLRTSDLEKGVVNLTHCLFATSIQIN